ncbi:tape measure protein [Streptococcus cristatus]|uniref:Phage tail length tape-measure protein n=1 Tax=Streptococcus cristatus TaxID=45634 RepID=A0A139N2G4_STRCR|nr:tape measure protein [Streptococcus cristatus]KXT70007.1 Phage tail length tape-measure protein [Streptococcus cristatus]QBX13972.1 tail length tape-measure protein [Streptococcus phage Javan115]
MASDGKVTITIDLDSTKARGEVKSLKSLFSGLSESGSKLGSVFKSVLGANLVSSAITSGIGMVGSGIREMVGELNSSQKAWKTFEGNLQAFGRSSDEIRKAKTEMQDFATKTIYSASDMASTYSQLDAVGTKNVGSLVKAFGGLAASAENPAQAMKSLSTQATQMASKPKVAWMDFKIMMEQAPAGMAAVAKEMGMSTAELVSAVQDGKIKTEDFFDAMNRAGNSDAFQKMATEFKTVDQAIDGAKESLSNKLMPAFEKLNAFGIKAVNALSNALEKINFGKLADGLGKFLESIDVEKIVAKVSSTISNLAGKVKAFWTAFANTGAVSAFISAIQSIAGAIGHIWNSLTASNELNILASVLGNVVKWLSQAATVAANFISSLPAGAIQAIVGGLIGLVAGFKTFNFLKSFNPFNIFKRNATEAASGAAEAITQGRSKIAQILSSLSSVISSIGGAVKSAATGIGVGIKAALSGLSQVILAFGAALQTAGVANILAFGGAIAIAAVGIGAGVAIIAAGFALLASQSQGVATIINAVGEAFATVATAIIGAFAQAIVTVAGVLPTVTSALAELAPLVVAFGQAFAAAAPFVTSLGDAITSIISVLPPVIDAFSQGAATIIDAVTPIVDIVGNVFVSVAQIIADVVVQIVQALAPFMPAVSEMVQSLAPVLQSIVEAFTALINQISPIIDSIANLFTSLGDSIKTVLDGAKGVIEGFGNAVKSILDGIAGIFDSIGNAALNAGRGFKLLAQGVVMITNTKLGDMAASLAAVATGVGAISAVSGGMASAGSGMKSLGQGMVMVSTAGTGASGALGALAGIVPTVSSTLSALGPTIAVAGAAMRTFAASAVASFIGLSASAGHLTAFNSSLTSLQSAIATVSASVTMFGSYLLSMTNHVINASTNILRLGTAVYQMQAALYQTSSATLSVGQSLLALKSMASSAMSGMVAAIGLSMAQAQAIIRRASQEFVRSIASIIPLMKQSGMQAGQGSGQGVSAGIMSTIGLAVAAMNAMIAAVRSAGLSGVGSMHYIGAMIGQGLAQGMYSALGAVTAAANALVAQAERAAQAKAKIHSPSRLFRDNVGRYISQGVAVGILADAYKVDDAMGNMYDQIQSFNFKAEDVIGVGKSKLSKVVQIKSDLENAIKAKVESTKDKANELVEKALDIAERAVERPVETYLDGDTLVARTGDRQRAYQERQTKIYNRMRGIDK